MPLSSGIGRLTFSTNSAVVSSLGDYKINHIDRRNLSKYMEINVTQCDSECRLGKHVAGRQIGRALTNMYVSRKT